MPALLVRLLLFSLAAFVDAQSNGALVGINGILADGISLQRNTSSAGSPMSLSPMDHRSDSLLAQVGSSGLYVLLRDPATWSWYAAYQLDANSVQFALQWLKGLARPRNNMYVHVFAQADPSSSSFPHVVSGLGSVNGTSIAFITDVAITAPSDRSCDVRQARSCAAISAITSASPEASCATTTVKALRHCYAAGRGAGCASVVQFDAILSQLSLCFNVNGPSPMALYALGCLDSETDLTRDLCAVVGGAANSGAEGRHIIPMTMRSPLAVISIALTVLVVLLSH